MTGLLFCPEGPRQHTCIMHTGMHTRQYRRCAQTHEALENRWAPTSPERIASAAPS
jgi:hypothetical protein